MLANGVRVLRKRLEALMSTPSPLLAKLRPLARTERRPVPKRTTV